MATIKLKWKAIKISANLSGWIDLRNEINNQDLLAEICSTRTIYVIRLCRPFAIHYQNNVSCTAYIGRGDFQKRMTSHIKNWIRPLAAQIKDLKIEVLVCLPRVQKNFNAYKDVEASLIDRFETRYGSIPLKNKRREKSRQSHNFNRSEVAKALGLGSGRGFHWAIWPVGSNPLRRS